jgi:DNA repair ATPase RecN
MKIVTMSILNKLQDEAFNQNVSQLLLQNPDAVHGDVTASDARNTYETMKDLILKSISNQSFDRIAYQRRNTIDNALDSIVQNIGNPQNAIIQIESILDQATISGIYYSDNGKSNIKKQLDDLTKLKIRYNNYIKSFEETKKTLDFISKKRNELDQLVTTSHELAGTITTIQNDATIKFQGIEETARQVDTQKQQIDQKAQEVEDKKLGVNTFSNNIEDYKTNIDDLVKKSEAIIAKQKEIDKIIGDAEKALQLNSAIGVSAAFSAKYTEASDVEVYFAWLFSAIILMLVAFAGTAWIVGGWGISDPQAISSIIGRIVAVGVALTGATFCANQYVKQKNLAEDYAYKATLSKSIIAFTGEIAKNDDKDNANVASYLKQVLGEIHKDPLRNHSKEVKSENINIDTINKVAEIFKIVKT